MSAAANSDSTATTPSPSYVDVAERQLQDYSVSVLLQTILFIMIFISGSAWTAAVSKSFNQENKLKIKELNLKLDLKVKGVRNLDTQMLQGHINDLRVHNSVFIRKYFIFALALTMVSCAVAILIGVLAKTLRGSIRINLDQIFAAI